MSYTNITKDLNESESLFEMTNLTPKRTGLNVIILSEQNTEIKNKSSKEPKFKIIGKDYSISYSLEENPKILAAELITVFTCRYSRNGGRIYGTENV